MVCPRSSRKDLVLRGCQPDLLLLTGARSPYVSVVERMFRDLDKEKVTMLKVDKAGDVLAESVCTLYSALLNYCAFRYNYCKGHHAQEKAEAILLSRYGFCLCSFIITVSLCSR